MTPRLWLYLGTRDLDVGLAGSHHHGSHGYG